MLQIVNTKDLDESQAKNLLPVGLKGNSLSKYAFDNLYKIYKFLVKALRVSFEGKKGRTESTGRGQGKFGFFVVNTG